MNCIEWPNARNAAGYGTRHDRGRKVYVHRWAWESVNGPIPDGGRGNRPRRDLCRFGHPIKQGPTGHRYCPECQNQRRRERT